MTDARLAYRDASGAWRSEGRRLLEVVRGTGADKKPLKAFGYELGITEQYVGHLLEGRRQPSADIIARIFLAYGIEGHTWGLAPRDVKLPVSKPELPNTDEVSQSKEANAV